ncbi:MAG: peptidyl-prolyl cis-trans isomerase [Acidobacteriaceae bacterium]
MILRFAPSRFALLSAVLATSLSLFSTVALADNAKDTQPQTPYPGTVVEEAVARVNDQVISTSDYKRAEQSLEQEAQQRQWTEQQLFDQKHELLRDLIDQQLLLSRGKQLDITGETELVKQLDAMRKRYHLDTMDDLQKAAEAQGVSWADFKANMRNQIITQDVIRQEVGSHINISPSEVQAYYDAHKDDFNEPEQERLSEILIPTADPDNGAQVAAAKQKADDAEAKLKGGTDFATLAKSVSGGMTAANGGDLGQFRRGQLAKVLEDQTFDLKPGEYTEPIRTKQGWIILKVTEHTAGGIQPLKDVEPQVENAIGEQKMQPALRAYLTKLREDAFIEIKDGYEDSGASPNEMKPVYSAYTPPKPKKKKKKNWTRFNARGRKANARPATETASAGTTTQENVTMKPGKREKIRFGQAPRETLPPAPTKTVNAGNGTQVATSNDVSNVIANEGAPPEQPEPKQKKTRFANSPKRPKKHTGPKIDPFAPPPETTEELATQKQQDQPLGLNGDTSKKKKVKPSKEGPKRRFSDQKKQEAQPASPTTSAAAPDSGTSQQ